MVEYQNAHKTIKVALLDAFGENQSIIDRRVGIIAKDDSWYAETTIKGVSSNQSRVGYECFWVTLEAIHVSLKIMTDHNGKKCQAENQDCITRIMPCILEGLHYGKISPSETLWLAFLKPKLLAKPQSLSQEDDEVIEISGDNDSIYKQLDNILRNPYQIDVFVKLL